MSNEELLVALPNWISGVDLGSPEFTETVVEVGLGPSHLICGAAGNDEAMVAVSEDGVLHVIRRREPGGPRPVASREGEPGDAILSANHGFTTVQNGDWADPVMQGELFDLSSPEAPITLRVVGWMSIGSRFLLGTIHLYSFGWNLCVGAIEAGYPLRTDIPARDFTLVKPYLGAAVAADGLRMIDTSDPATLTVLSQPFLGSLCEVTTPVGYWADAAMVAALDEAGDVQVWDATDAEEPVQIGRLASGFDTIVHLDGGHRRLLAGVESGDAEWPGAVLRLVDCTDPTQPTLAGSLRVPGPPNRGWLSDPLLYLACGTAGLVVVDITDLALPRIHGGLGTHEILDVRQIDEHLLVAGRDIVVLEVDDAGPLPVALDGFTANLRGDEVLIQWSLRQGSAVPQFRLIVDEASGSRMIAFAASGGVWSASDEPSSWQATYRLEIRHTGSGDWQTLAEQSVSLDAPPSPLLLPSVPNPANPRALIRCELPRDDRLRLRVIDVAGRLVRVLADEHRLAGRHRFEFDGKNAQGREMPSGTYLVEMETSAVRQVRKLQIVR